MIEKFFSPLVLDTFSGCTYTRHMTNTTAPAIRTITKAEFDALVSTARPTGTAVVVGSGTFIQGYDLPSGEHVDHYLNFGQFDKFILSPKGYREEPTFNSRWR